MERLVWPKVVVRLFPPPAERVVRVQVLRDLLQIMEFLLVRPMGPANAEGIVNLARLGATGSGAAETAVDTLAHR